MVYGGEMEELEAREGGEDGCVWVTWMKEGKGEGK